MRNQNKATIIFEGQVKATTKINHFVLESKHGGLTNQQKICGKRNNSLNIISNP